MKRIVGIFLVLLLLLLPLGFYFTVRIDDPTTITNLPQESEINHINDTTFQYKNNWLKKNEFGIWELYIEGSPVERGLAFGLLGKTLQKEKEEAFIGEIRKRIPSEYYLKTLKYFIGWFNRDLDKHIPQEFKEEIFASSQFMSDEFDFVGTKYQRALNYHAAHDIGHALQNMKMVGCTALASWRAKSEEGSLIIGRNFDFYFGEAFAKDKILAFVKPDSGYAFSSVTWAGFSGVVSGMNEKGLTITLNSAKSDIPTKAKTPVSLIARNIIQYAATIDEAFKIAQSMEAFVTETYLIGSASENRVALIEKTDTETALFTQDANSNYLIATNHLQSKSFESQELNQEQIDDEVSVYRHQRVKQLLSNNGQLNIHQLSEILRNQKGLDEADLGMANEKCVNQLIAHHSVMFKPKENLIWISAMPYCLGDYSAYNIKAIFNNPANAFHQTNYIDSLNINKDSFLQSNNYQKFEAFHQTKESIMEFLFSGKPFQLSDQEVTEFIGNNPNSYLPYYYLGQFFMQKEAYQKSIYYFQEGLKKEVARTSEKDFMNEQIEKAREYLK